jgi:PAS domain S-box-containing protein
MTSPVSPHASKPLVTRNDTVAERYASLVERTGYGVYRTTPDGRFIEANAALATMLDYDSIDDVMRLDLARDIRLDWVENDPAPGAAPEWIETKWKRRDGNAITVRLNVRAIVGANGEVEAYDGIVEDVTDRRRKDELLRRTARMASLGTTLAGVAHELNNPLAAIMGFAQLLLRKVWPTEDQQALETINRESIRSAAIVKDLLALTRRRDVERRAPTDVNDVVSYILRTRRYALETAGINCVVHLYPALPSIHGDRAQLEQVILNLLSNAEHALLSRPDHAAAGRIVLRTRQEGTTVIIEVEDNGPGVPEESRARIWDPFWTTKDESEGMGLGLAVVHGIVTDHGGTIALEDGASAGIGARFMIRLPAIHAPAIADRASRPLDVLVVDPGASDPLFVERFLTARGHAVISAGSGDLALRLAAQTPFDAVLCDARLVSRDGTPVAAALRATEGCATARFVLSASAPIEAHLIPGTIRGATLVSRPYDIEELRRLIEGD